MSDLLPLITSEVSEAMRMIDVMLAYIDATTQGEEERSEWDDLHDELDSALAQLQQAAWRIEDWGKINEH